MSVSTRTLLLLLILCRHASAANPDASASAALIDRHVDARLTSERIQSAAPAADAEFLRRIHLDLHGRVPTLEQTTRFLSDPNPDKRTRLVDLLLADPRYGEHLADIWQAYLISPLADDPQRLAARLRPHLAAQFNTKTWDVIASDLLTATGKLEENPAVAYLFEGRLPRAVPDLTDLTTRYFLGVRLNCAQCHDHPTVSWKQQDFWGMAAFFTQVQTPKRTKQIYEKGILDDTTLTLATLKDANTIDGFIPRPPTFLGGREMPRGSASNRAAFAQWLTARDNPFFARAMVNRTWWRLFGRGLVTPVDDMHEANGPSHPGLLDALARHFIDSGYDLKSLHRAIVLSNAYQRTSRTTAADDKQLALFGRMSMKVLSAPQLYDSLDTIFGAPTRTTGIDTRLGPRVEFTQFFGDSADPDPIAYRRGIPHLLRQMNSPQFAGRNLDALVAKLTTPNRPPADVATDLFLTILSRPPTPDEQSRFKSYVDRTGSAQDAARELAWVLIMTSEFSLNH